MGCKDHFSHLQVLVEVLDHHDAVLVVTSLLGYVVLNLKIQKSVEFSIDMPYLQNLNKGFTIANLVKLTFIIQNEHLSCVCA